MTKEEAIKTIESRDSIMDYCESAELGEALDVAIEALSAIEDIKAELAAEIDAHKLLSQGFAPSAWDRGYIAAIVDVQKAIDKHVGGKESE